MPVYIFLGLVSCVTINPALASSSPDIFPPESEPYGLSYAEHAQNFWKWLLQIPLEVSPFVDQTGENCSVGQEESSPIFYLALNPGGSSERECTVPSGKGILIPLMAVEISDKEFPGATVDDLRSSAKQDQDSVISMSLRIDDKEFGYADLLKYRIQPTEPFQVVFPDNAIFGVTESGPSTVVADGFYILTEPLTEGNHTIQFDGNIHEPTENIAFASDILYKISVE